MLMKKIRVFFTAMVLTLAAIAASAQNITVVGQISDEAGEPIIGANVVLQGSRTVYSMTGADGTFKLNVPASGILEITCLGYVAQEVPVQSRTSLNIVLPTDMNLLDETIVVAFGTATKESFTGSATVVGSDKLEKLQVTDVTRALEGAVPGVQMTTSSGTLGTKPTIVIRGIGTISADSDPLIVVDGIPFPGDLNTINPADIESITVQKDAASNALYGARGANGVIMITTKRAKSSNAVVSLDAKVGVNSKALQHYDYITDPAQYYETYYSALYNNNRLNKGMSDADAYLAAASIVAGPIGDGGLGYNIYNVPDGQFLIGSNGKLNPAATRGRIINYNGQDYYIDGDDWMEAAYRTSIRQEYNLNVSGSGDKYGIYASIGYLNNQGIIEAAKMDRFTGRIKADYQAKPWLKIGANLGFSHYTFDNGNSDEGGGSVGNVFSFASSIAPIFPVYIRDGQGNILRDQYGNIRYDFGNGANAGLYRAISSNSNALQLLSLDVNNNNGNSFNGNGFAEVSFLKHFKATITGGYGVDESRYTTMNNMYYGQFAVNGGVLGKEHDRSTYFNLQQLLNYSQSFGDFHVDVLLGHENYESKGYGLWASKKKMFSIDNLEFGGAVIDGQSAGSSLSEYNNEGYFARFQVDDNNTMFLSGSIRADASSRFHPKHRWGVFWSLGYAWVLSKEKWFTAPWIDMFKFKASIGSQGNDQIGNYRYIDRYVVANNEGDIAVSFYSKGNEEITWETATNFNTGFEFELFKSRLNGSIEYFNRTTSNMLFWFTVPASLGYSGYYANIGDMRNRGVEFDLEGVLVRTKNIQWSVNLNGTHFRNKIIRLPEERKTKTYDGHGGYESSNKFIGEGLPLNTYLLKKYAGVNQETGESQWWMHELDADGNETGKEVTTTKYGEASYYLGKDTAPDLYGGFSTSFVWGNFDFSAQFTYQLGGLVYDSGYASLMSSPTGNVGGNIHKDILKAWTPENHSETIPRFVYGDSYTAQASDRFLTSASYLNFQAAQVGYTLPQKWTTKIGISRLRLYVTADNIIYWSARQGLDPRQSLTGATNDSMNSPVRTVSGGINIVF